MKLKNNIKLLIAADGGAASGKTTASKLLSKKYKLNFLSSGTLYRYISFKLIKKKKFVKNYAYLKKITKNITSKKLRNRKLFNSKITEFSAEVAKIKKIRILLKKYQKNFAKQNHVCIEGRDIGSVICPNADIKFFFKCNLKIRAKRRWAEYKKINPKISLLEVKNSLFQCRVANILKFHWPSTKSTTRQLSLCQPPSHTIIPNIPNTPHIPDRMISISRDEHLLPYLWSL